MKLNPFFSKPRSIFFDVAQLNIDPYSAAISISRYAYWKGSDLAISWFKGIATCKETLIRHSGFASGVSTEKELSFSNGVILKQIELAGDSFQVRHIKSIFHSTHPLELFFGNYSSHNCIIYKETNHNRTNNFPDNPVSNRLLEDKEDILLGCILNKGLSPSLTVNWHEFVDSDLEKAETSQGFGGFPQDAPVSNGRSLNDDDIRNIELFLCVEGDLKKSLRLALSRIGLAKRKSSIENKAIELCIALESLLNDGKSELTHKISTRAALILGREYSDRVRFRNLFKKLYNIRSSAVHGQKS